MEIPSGNPDSARSIVRGLGRNYRGAVIHDQFIGADELRSLALELSGYGSHPVCYLDTGGGREGIRRNTPRFPKSFCYLHLDEKTAVSQAVDMLVRCGHRRVGYTMFGDQSVDWMIRRRTLLDAALKSARAELVVADLTEPFWIPSWTSEINKHAAFGQRLDAFIQRPATITSAAQSLLSNTPSMRKLLDAVATAIIAANDWMAQQVYLWCRGAGIAVPGDLSMITFDNTPDSEAMPITNIDFGLAYLGYAAAHIILNDIPLRIPSDGRIAGPVRVMDRGSVGESKRRTG
jgi:DNA-binding LacI/PurR family transcriptional regulator